MTCQFFKKWTRLAGVGVQGDLAALAMSDIQERAAARRGNQPGRPGCTPRRGCKHSFAAGVRIRSEDFTLQEALD